MRGVRNPVYRVETPENLSLHFEPAGLASRALAQGVDLLFTAAFTQLVLWLLSPLELITGAAAGALWIVVGFLVQWGYGALSEWRFAGQTLGKRLNGLVVVDASGLRISFSQAVVRNLLRIVDLLPGFYLAGTLCSLLDRSGRRLGDLAARTVVVRSQRARPPKSALSRAVAPLDGWTRTILSHLSGDERRALIALANALEELSVTDRIGLSRALVAHFVRRHRLSLPAQLSAEKVVLHLRELLGAERFDRRPQES